MNQHSVYQQLRSHLAYLRLGAAAEALPAHLERAQQENLNHTAFLERLLAVEVQSAEERRLAGRLRFACFPAPWRLQDFDFDAQPAVDRKLVEELATLRFVEEKANVLLGRSARRRQDDVGGLLGPSRCRGWLPRLLHHRCRARCPLSARRSGGALGDHHALLRRTRPPDL